MKKVAHISFLFCFALIALPPMALSQKPPSETGRQIFTDPSWGGSATNGKSCASCHENGKNLETASKKANLTELINKCITSQMGGKKVDGRSSEMRAVKLYIKSFAK